MGIDYHALNFLMMMAQESPLGKTLTLGRQRIHMGKRAFEKVFGANSDIIAPGWSDPLWSKLGATSVTSIDASDYEGADLVQDLTQAVDTSLHGKFDTIFDGGTLQHIIDPIAVLSNCRDMCRIGGRVIHVVPANNFCGFGFYQFSPELFQAFYEANGFSRCRIYLAKLDSVRTWYAYKLREGMLKPTFRNCGEVYVLVTAAKSPMSLSGSNTSLPTQHEYAVKWGRKHDARLHTNVRRSIVGRILYRARATMARKFGTIGSGNPALEAVRINSLVGSGQNLAKAIETRSDASVAPSISETENE